MLRPPAGAGAPGQNSFHIRPAPHNYHYTIFAGNLLYKSSVDAAAPAVYQKVLIKAQVNSSRQAAPPHGPHLLKGCGEPILFNIRQQKSIFYRGLLQKVQQRFFVFRPRLKDSRHFQMRIVHSGP